MLSETGHPPAVCHGGCPAPRRGRRWLRLSLAPTLLVALAPKCPLCWLGYATTLGAAGLWRASSHYAAWMPPLTLGALALALVAISFQGRGGGRSGPLLLGSAAAVAVAVARLGLDSVPLAAIAAVLLVGAFVWSGRQARRQPRLGIESERRETP